MRIHFIYWLTIVVLVGACSEQPQDNKITATADETQAGETQAGETPADETQAGETQAGEDQAGETQAGEIQAGETQAGEVVNSAPNTETIYEGLKPVCSACHDVGFSFPAFASLAEFNRLIVSDQQWVVPREPDQSSLIDLLVGTYAGESTYAQMPPSGSPYSALIDDNPQAPSMEDIRFWIEQLEVNSDPEPEITACSNVPLKGLMARLSKDEYRNTIRDILGSELDPSADFPEENESYGFSHISALLTLSPLLIEKYDLAAIELAEEAIPQHSQNSETFVLEAETDLNSTTGASTGSVWNLWSNGLLSTFFNPPASGTYEITMTVAGGQAGPDPVRFALVVDGENIEVFETNVQTPARDQITTTITLNASEHQIGLRFLNDYYCPQARFDLGECPGLGDRNLLVDNLVIRGPEAIEVPPSNFENRYLDCDPQALGYESCGRSILTRFGRMAWRRPLSNNEVDRLWQLMNNEISTDMPTLNQWRDGLRQAIHAILLSPNFIFRVELSPEGTSLNAYERASRLAAFIWRSSPDEALLDAAASGRLDTLEGQSLEIERLLADSRAQALIQDFGGRFMQLHHLDDLEPDYAIFPNFNEELRSSMTQEMQRTLQTLMSEQRSLLDLVNLDFTWIDQNLAQFYGLTDAYSNAVGRGYKRISLPQAGRKGLLTQGAWLTVTSHPTRTSPVHRGKWVLENLLCSPPPPPPPNVEGLPESGVDQNASIRERFEQHRADPACAACHTHMDSIGFAFEPFNGIGEFRLVDGNEVIDPSGTLPVEPPISFVNTVELVDILRNDPALPRCITERMIIYALGRGLAENEHCFVSQIMDQSEQYSLQSLARAIAGSVLMNQQGEMR